MVFVVGRHGLACVREAQFRVRDTAGHVIGTKPTLWKGRNSGYTNGCSATACGIIVVRDRQCYNCMRKDKIILLSVRLCTLRRWYTLQVSETLVIGNWGR
jgi:hypothetical protein